MASAALLADDVVVTRKRERRGSARSPLFIAVRVRGCTDTMLATDISLGGMQCQSKRARWPGTYLDLDFTLPGTQERFSVGAQVLSIDQGEEGKASIGLRFCRVSPALQMAIYRFLDRRRSLWSDDVTPIAHVWAERYPSLAPMFAAETPFAGLVREAEASLRAKERQGVFRSLFARLLAN